MSLWTRLRSLPALLAAEPSQPQRLDVLQETDPAIPWLSPGGFLNPNLDTGTDRMGQWQELHDALRDPKAAACLDLRCQVVSSLPWTLEPGPGTPPAVTDLVREALEGLNLIEDFEELAKASYYGLVPCEVHWEVRPCAGQMRLVPRELESFDPFYLNFDADRTPTVNGRVWEPGKLLLHRHGSHFRNPWGLGRGRTVPRWTRVKVAVAYATYRDYPRYAHDRLMLTYPADSGDIEQSRYIAVANKLIDAPGLVVPEGMDAKGIKLESKFEVGAKLIEAANGEIATAIVGNTLTTGEGKHGTQALGSVHQEQTDRQEVADAKRIEATFNRTLIPWIVLLNFGPGVQPPRFHFEHQLSATLKERLESAQGWRREGLKISQAWIRTTFGIPAPVEEADALEPVAPAPAQPLKPEVPHADSPGKAGAHGDPEEAKLSADDPLEGMFARWGSGYLQRQAAVPRLLAQALGEAVDYTHAQETLLATARDFPTSAAEYLATCLQAARDAGAWEADREVEALNLTALNLDAEPQLDFGMTPELALRWLMGKTPMTIKQADALKDAELRARAFWMAGVDQMGTLQALQKAMAEALAKGIPFDQFKGTWLAKLQSAGITEGRLRTAFDLQLHQAYMGGRMASLQANDAVENLTFVTAGDESVRPEHAIYDGVTLPKGHVFWSTHCPPLGFNCRCRIRAAGKDEKVTASHDPRLSTPPDQGFGEGAPAFNRYLDRVAQQPAPVFQPIAPSTGGWSWLEATRPSHHLAPSMDDVAGPRQGLLTDPTGREVYVPMGVDGAPVLSPGEVWLAPVLGPEGQVGLQIAYLRGNPGRTTDVVTVMNGVARKLSTPDPTPYRQGVRFL